MLYKYETHSHTSETSRCSRISGAELARFYKSLGYDGLFVTDHFFGGNTSVPYDLDWDERVRLFLAGYRAAKAEGDRIGLDVFPGWEYTLCGNDFLVYGLDEDWLLANPDQMKLSIRDYMKKAREDGGLVIHAHPFREAGYIDMIRLIPRDVDGVEVNNASMTDEVNRRAEWYAESYGLLRSAGSDNHYGQRGKLSGVLLPERLKTGADFVRLMKSGAAELFSDRYDENGKRI